MRLAVVTTSVSSSNNNIPFAIGRPIYSRISSERGGIRRLSAEVIFGLVSIRTRRKCDANWNIPSNIIRHEATRRAENDQRKGHTTVSQEEEESVGRGYITREK